MSNCDDEMADVQAALEAIWCAVNAREAVAKGDQDRATRWMLNSQTICGSVPPWQLASVAALTCNRELLLIVSERFDKSGGLRQRLTESILTLTDVVEGEPRVAD